MGNGTLKTVRTSEWCGRDLYFERATSALACLTEKIGEAHFRGLFTVRQNGAD